MKPKALLVTSPSNTKNKCWNCSITSPIGSLMTPCDLASIAGKLLKEDIEAKILDLRFYRDPFKALLTHIDEWKPDSIIINIATASALEDYPILNKIKGKIKQIIAFGFHAMALPEEVFHEGATHILAGDPEYSVVKVINGETNTDGIWTKENFTEKPGWIDNLDNLPYPALNLLDVRRYHTVSMGKDPFSLLLSSRGCPNKCPYCTMPFLFGKKLRLPSVERVIGEIERDIKEFNIKTFFFLDSAINLNLEWLIKLCNEIVRKNLNIRWCCHMRISPVNMELLTLMKKAGCFRIYYGVEDLDIVQQLNRKFSRDETREAFKLTNKAGIDTVAFIMLFPDIDKTENDMINRFINMLQDIETRALQCNLAIPLPGTQLYKDYMERYNMPKNWDLYDPAGNQLPYPTDLDLIHVRRMIYLKFFLKNPVYLWDIFKNTDIRSIFTFIRNSSKVLGGIKSATSSRT